MHKEQLHVGYQELLSYMIYPRFALEITIEYL